MPQTTVSLALTLEELWLLQQYVRQPDKAGQVWDRDDMRQVHLAILHLEESKEECYEVECTSAFLWQIEAQINQGLRLGQLLIGRQILLKVFNALHKQAEGDNNVWDTLLQETIQRDGDTSPHDTDRSTDS